MGHSPINGMWTFIGKADYTRPVVSIGDELENYYVIDRSGHVYSLYTGQELSQITDSKGYKLVSLTVVGGKRIQRRVHRLVMYTFCYYPGCELMDVDHFDGNKSNNDISNLTWVTPKVNTMRAINNNQRPSWAESANPKSVLNAEEVQYILSLALQGYGNQQISSMFPKASIYIVADICQGNTWKNIATPEIVQQIKLIRRPIIISTENKHKLCQYFQDNPFANLKCNQSKGAKTMYIKTAMEAVGILYTESTFRMAKRLFYKIKGQDPDIVCLYNY